MSEVSCFDTPIRDRPSLVHPLSSTTLLPLRSQLPLLFLQRTASATLSKDPVLLCASHTAKFAILPPLPSLFQVSNHVCKLRVSFTAWHLSMLMLSTLSSWSPTFALEGFKPWHERSLLIENTGPHTSKLSDVHPASASTHSNWTCLY